MLADIRQAGQGYIAYFERYLEHSARDVWSWLTENDKLAQWFPELRIDDLREGGAVRFDMQNGTFEELKIIGLRPGSVLEYAWGGDQVRFEIHPEAGGCRLILIEKLVKITDHTPKDLAGWHVCLNVIQKLMNGQAVERRHEEWKIWYEKYKEILLK